TAQAGDLHGVQLGGLLRILRERGIDDDHAADDGEHRPRAELLLQLVAHQGVLSTGGLSGTGGHRWRVRAACGRGHAQRQRWTWKACTSCKTSISLRTFEWVFPYAQGFPDGAFGGLRSMQQPMPGTDDPWGRQEQRTRFSRAPPALSGTLEPVRNTDGPGQRGANG